MIEFINPCPVAGEHKVVVRVLEILDFHWLRSEHLRPSSLSETFRCIDGVYSESSFGNCCCIEHVAYPCRFHYLKTVRSFDRRKNLSVMPRQYAQSSLSVDSVFRDRKV